MVAAPEDGESAGNSQPGQHPVLVHRGDRDLFVLYAVHLGDDLGLDVGVDGQVVPGPPVDAVFGEVLDLVLLGCGPVERSGPRWLLTDGRRLAPAGDGRCPQDTLRHTERGLWRGWFQR